MLELSLIQILSLIGAGSQLIVFGLLQTRNISEDNPWFSFGMTVGSIFLILASIQNIELIGFLILEVVWFYFSVLPLVRLAKNKYKKGKV